MNAIIISPKSHTIEMSNSFAKAASIFGSDEYNQLQIARRDYPNYRVVTVKQKGTGSAEFAKLSFKFMDKYVKDHANTDNRGNEYRSLRGLKADWEKDENGFAEEFQIIKDWFLNTFPEFEQAHKERVELLKKIKEEKKKRLADRKKAA